MEITVFKVFVDVQGHIGVALLVRLMEKIKNFGIGIKTDEANVLLAFSLLLLPLLLRLGAFMQHAIRQVRYKILGCLAGRVASNFVLHIVHTCLRRDSTPA